MALYRKLRALMYEYGDTQEELAYYLDRSVATISLRLCGKSHWTVQEMYLLMDRYHIPDNQLHMIFPRSGKADADLPPVRTRRHTA